MEESYSSSSSSKERADLVIIFVVASLALTSLFVAFSYYCYISNKLSRRRFLNQHQTNKGTDFEDNTKAYENVQVTTEKGLQLFTFKQLHSATGGFTKSNLIGHGGFGLVYRGVLQNGRKIAVKVMDRAGKQGEEEFQVEVELLSRLRSPYLLTLVGFCSESNHKLLVYEFMANGGLQEHLYRNGGSSAVSSLKWEIRLRIALEAAKGLEYLHEHVSPPVIHRDFKSSNILLDRNFHARVSDFGLAKLGSDKAGGHVSTRVLGTQGYVAPEYALTGHLTTKSDVYSYGVVLLELLTGRVPVDMKRAPGECVLVAWALPWLTDREKVETIMDPKLEGQYSMKEVVQVAAIAAMCVQPEADYRPLMADVVQSLVPLVKQHRPNIKLSANYYASSCPRLQTIVRNALTPNVRSDRRLGASLLRMFFHDCFVNGCDASVLLDDTSSLTGEKNAFPNQNSLRGFQVIDAIKTRVEAACKDTVSCADILALVARDGTVLLGGPSWTVPLGRRDSTTASQMQANLEIPNPADDLSTLISRFANKGLSAKEMTVLSGSHTIGQAQCITFRAHIYNDTNINAAFAASLKARCPASAPNGDANLAPLDLQSPNSFGSDYYQNLVAKRGLLHSDQELFNGGSQDALVRTYSNNNRAFRNDFAAAMIKMGNISPLTGTDGEIRKNCRVPN